MALYGLTSIAKLILIESSQLGEESYLEVLLIEVL